MIDPTDLFSASERAFESAADRWGVIEAHYHVADKVLALRFASSSLAAKLLPALMHLDSAEGASADLTIACWDDASSRIDIAGLMPKADRRGLEYIDGPLRLAWGLEDQSLQAYDPNRRVALFRIPNAAELAAWEQGAPFQRILHWWAAGLGLQFVHGAAVGNEAGGVLLAGPGGSGKSTTALASVGSSLGYLADDYCILEPGAPPRVHAIYNSGKADAGSISRLPHLAEAFQASSVEQHHKTIIFIAEQNRAAILRSCPLRAIIVPKIIAGTLCRAEPLPRGEALRALAPSTLFQMPGDRASSLSRMSTLIRHLPCFRLYVGEDPTAARPLLEDIILGQSPGS